MAFITKFLADCLHRDSSQLISVIISPPKAQSPEAINMALDGAFAKALIDQMLDKGSQDRNNGFSHGPIRLVDHPAIRPFVEVWDIG